MLNRRGSPWLARIQGSRLVLLLPHMFRRKEGNRGNYRYEEGLGTLGGIPAMRRGPVGRLLPPPACHPTLHVFSPFCLPLLWVCISRLPLWRGGFLPLYLPALLCLCPLLAAPRRASHCTCLPISRHCLLPTPPLLPGSGFTVSPLPHSCLLLLPAACHTHLLPSFTPRALRFLTHSLHRHGGGRSPAGLDPPRPRTLPPLMTERGGQSGTPCHPH